MGELDVVAVLAAQLCADRGAASPVQQLCGPAYDRATRFVLHGQMGTRELKRAALTKEDFGLHNFFRPLIGLKVAGDVAIGPPIRP
jgi:hypothetical protein